MEKSLEQDLPIPEHAYAGSELCVLENDDMQCGHIFFNEATRLLKFFCTYCRQTYDNINYFCEHLSQHINGDTEAYNELNEFQDDVNSWLAPTVDEDMLEGSSVENYIDEAEQIAAEVQEEMRQSLKNDGIYLDENSSSDFFGYDEEMESKPSPTIGFEMCFINEGRSGELKVESDATDTREENDKAKQFSNSDASITSKKAKKKRVTTVKVIAVKNKVAELYEKYKLELEKRSQTNGSIIAKTIEDKPTLSTSTPDSDINIRKESPVLQQKIIGETVITLLPEGASGIVSKTSDSVPHSNTLSIMPLPQITPAQSSDNHAADKERTCPACGKMFRSSFSLSIHKRSHYLESDSNIKLAHKCSHCDALFNKISELKEHIDKIHYPDGFVCKVCNKRLSRLALLEMHMRKIHLKRPLHCNICKKNFSNREAFEVHQSSHVEGQDYRCHICGRKYPTEYVLKHHMQRHKERVQKCCVVCGKMTLRITQHMKIHTPSPKRILSCSVCGKIFNFSSGLSHHFKINHKFPRPPPKPKRENTNPIKRKRKAREHLKIKSEEIDKKEEEAKRVIVELIENATYTPFIHNQYTHGVQTTPPIAREEVICAVNSIVSDS